MHIKLPAFIKNKYLIALLVVAAWLLFFDKNNMIQQWRLQRQLHELRHDKHYYLEEIARDSTELQRLKEDPEALERYARETYMMKKENEDIFITPDPH
jgi:cell division protein DivIC